MSLGKLGHYTIIRKLGQGGMGHVLLAEDTRLRRRVALKVLPPELASNPSRLRRFQREAEVIAALNHPNIVTLYNLEESDGVHFLTMEWVEGESLDHVVVPGGLPLAHVFDIGIAMADALAAAHDKGIVHRDLKPANVMLDCQGSVRVLDFGLAKLDADTDCGSMTDLPTRDPSLTGEGVIVGTVPYMSPEQVQGQELDQRADVFSLGSVLHELSTGQRPFAGENSAELISSIMRDRPRPVHEMRSDVPRQFGRIVTHCMQKDREKRFQSAKDVRNELIDLRQEIESGTPLMPTARAQSAGPDGLPTAPWSARSPFEGSAPTTPPGSSIPEPPSLPSGVRPVERARPFLWALAGAAIVIAVVAAFWLGGVRSSRSHDAATSADADRVGTPAAHVEKASIAVLPFRNLSTDPEQEYFSDGLAEELMSVLGKTPELKVSGRTSSFSFKGKDATLRHIGRQLGVAKILEGSVRKSGDRIRVSVQLVSAVDGFQLWSETYERETDDIFSVQVDIARSVAEALQVTLLGVDDVAGAVHPNADAYDLVLRARFVMRKTSGRTIARARALVEQALEIAPDYALAWAEKGVVHLRESDLASGVEERKLASERARAALGKALALDPDLGVAHSRLATMQSNLEWDFEAAERSTERALAADPTNPIVMTSAAQLNRIMGRPEAAIALERQILRTDPLYLLGYLSLGASYRYAGLLEEAEETLREGLDLEPDAPRVLLNLGQVLMDRGRVEEGRAAWERFLVLTGEDPNMRLYFDSLAAHHVGDTAGAGKLMLEFERRYCDSEPSTCAQFYAMRNRPDESFEWLERSYALREPGLPYSKTDPYLASLRDDPRWDPFWREVGFPAD